MTPARVESFARRALDGTPYVLTGVVGEGGMGYVFEAEHAELKRRAAIKVLGVRMAHNDRAMDRLRREARVLASLANPHIVDVYDMGFTADGQPYIAMSFIDGQDLAKNLAIDGPFAPTRVIDIVEQVAHALTAVHAQGMVHRDLKPENIMIEPRNGAEHVVLLDFGIAWVLDADTQITRDGQVMGTPGYISPEQALGMPVDGRADQYGLAAVVYQLLTGEAAYSGTSGLELMTAQLTSEPRPFAVDDAVVPAAMQAVVLRALSKDPDDRYADLNAFASALRASLAPSLPALAGPADAATRALPFALAAGLVLSTAALLLWAPWHDDASADRPSASAPVSLMSDSQAAIAKPEAETAAGPRIKLSNAPMTTVRREATVLVPAPASSEPKTTPPAVPARAPESSTPRTNPVAVAPTSIAPPSRPQAKRRRTVPPSNVNRIARAPSRPKTARRAPVSTAPEPAAPAIVALAPAPEPAMAPITRASPAPAASASRVPVLASTTRALAQRAPALPVQTQLVIDAPVVRGAVSDRPIRKALATSHGALRACVDQLPAPVTGRALIRLAIDADGFLSSVRGEGAPALVRCGVSAVKRVRRLSRRPDTGNIQVQVPIRMMPK